MTRVRSDNAEWKKLRDPAYGIRLNTACDQSPHCPDLNHGRLQWLQDQLKTKGEEVSRETIKRWLHGEVRAREPKSDALADILGVDRTWLFVGLETANQTVREKLAHSTAASGAANVVAGLIQLDGNTIAWPEENDRRANREKLDFYAIIRGANYGIHVTTAEIGGEKLTFKIPTEYENLIVLTLTRDGTNLKVAHLPTDLIAAGKSKGGWVELSFANSDQLDDLIIKDFTKRF